MGELVMTKNEGRLEFLDESIRFVAENGGIMKTDEFVAKEQQAHPGMDTTSCYHKIVMARYFGLVLYNKYSSYYFLTEAGTNYSRARSQNEKIDSILKALTSVTFGRNNNAVSSDSDIEAPVVMLKALSAMGSASMTQIGLIIYYMDIEQKTFAEATDIVQKLSDPKKLKKQLSKNKNSKYFDVKFNKLFKELGVIIEENDKYFLSQYVKDTYLDYINSLPEVKPIVSNAISTIEVSASSEHEDILSQNVYGIHTQKGKYTIEELADILSQMYKEAENKTTAIHMFGIKYAEAIINSGISAEMIVNASIIPNSYIVEVGKGIRIYKSIKENKYGISFVEENSVVIPEKSKKAFPAIPVRTRKTFDLNSILYGAPGTGKTYATAMYALAIVENKKLSDITKESRTEIMRKYNELINEGQVVFTTFHQNYGYEDFIQGIRPDTSANEMRFKTVDGVFKKIAETAMESPDKDFVVIIDEINRANISKVFGELITLIEDDKRWGEENAVSVTLPSGEAFAIPNNLYIVGTMNSADKSISLIDTALRRRFEFIEFIPDLSLVADKNLRKVLEKLNRGISAELKSSDLLVGHSYFINKDATDICAIMNRNIIPLLYEYFFDNKNKVEAQLKTCLEDLNVEIVTNSMGRIKIQNKEV